MGVDVIEPAHQPAHPTAVGMEWDSVVRAVSLAAMRHFLSSPQPRPRLFPGRPRLVHRSHGGGCAAGAAASDSVSIQLQRH